MLSLVGMKCDWTDTVIVYVNADSFLVVIEQMTNLMLVRYGINPIVSTSDLNAAHGANIRHSAMFGKLMTIIMCS